MNLRPGSFLPLLLGLLFLVTSCGPPHITPLEHERKRPGKATQRPYVIKGKTYYPIPNAEGYRETGIASWYGKQFHGRRTSNGETYNMYGGTAAHKTLPMGTMLLVKNLKNDKSTVVRINDRGPFVKSRIIDLSYAAAKNIGMIGNGTAKVTITALGEAVQQKSIGKKPSARPKLKHKDFDAGRFYVQVGSFEQRTNARMLARKFADKGRDVIIQQFPAAGTRLLRVMVFSGTSLHKAKQYEKYLENNGFPNALIIAR
ncbi:MAG TPA: septal ring lytic transglycosylase RlpA family protein [Desulfobulbaceae bacterium]|nr:septal ring lytic transglycosylase RlpA family protein [Desulfobulbaceae bacterium]